MSAPTPEPRYVTDPEHVFKALTKNMRGRILTILLDVPGGSHELSIDYISNSGPRTVSVRPLVLHISPSHRTSANVDRWNNVNKACQLNRIHLSNRIVIKGRSI